MKNPKNPTLKQKKIIKSFRLNTDNWQVVKNPPGELHIMHRHSTKVRVLKVS